MFVNTLEGGHFKGYVIGHMFKAYVLWWKLQIHYFLSFLGCPAVLSAGLQRVTKNYSTILIAIISISMFKLPTDLFSIKTTSKEIWKWIKISWYIYFFACKLKYFVNILKAKSLEDILLLIKSVLSCQNPSFNIVHNLKKIQVWIALGYSKNGRSQKDCLESTDQPVVEYVVLTTTGIVTVLDQVTVSSIKGSMAGCW